MRLPNDKAKYINNWKYFEFAYWDGKKVSRLLAGPATPKYFEWDQVEELRSKYKNTGLYSSVFAYNEKDLASTSRLASFYLDLDSDDPGEVLLDARKVVDYFSSIVPEQAIRIYYTGLKGFHIEVEAVALGITPSNDLPQIFRHIGSKLQEELSLTTADTAVWESRRMWRLPNSIHQKSGRYKREISHEDLNMSAGHIVSLSDSPNLDEVPEQVFSSHGNEWYRNQIYDLEASKQRKDYSYADLLERFVTHGSSNKKWTGEREFDPVRLFEGCPSILRLWKKAEETHNLEHEERLFLCSILSYTQESIEYLHSILANCDDYNFEKSNAHIEDWVRRREMDIGGRPYSCQRANEAGVGCADCKLEPRKRMVKVGDTYIETEEESKPSPIRFAYRIKRDN